MRSWPVLETVTSQENFQASCFHWLSHFSTLSKGALFFERPLFGQMECGNAGILAVLQQSRRYGQLKKEQDRVIQKTIYQTASVLWIFSKNRKLMWSFIYLDSTIPSPFWYFNCTKHFSAPSKTCFIWKPLMKHHEGNCIPAGLEWPPHTEGPCLLLLSHGQQMWKRGESAGPIPSFLMAQEPLRMFVNIQPACAIRVPEAPAAGCGHWRGSLAPVAQLETAAPQHPTSDHNKSGKAQP